MRKRRAEDNLFSVTHTFTYLFNQYELNTYYVLDTVIDIVFTYMIKTLPHPGRGDRHVYQKLQ